MKKENCYKFLYYISILLIVGFCIRLGADVYKITKNIYTNDIFLYIIVRMVEFIVPSIIIFFIARYMKKRNSEVKSNSMED